MGLHYTHTEICMCVCIPRCICAQTLGSLVLSYSLLIHAYPFWMSCCILKFIQSVRSGMENNWSKDLKVQFQSLRTELVLLLSRDAFL